MQRDSFSFYKAGCLCGHVGVCAPSAQRDQSDRDFQ